jgi:hypothetical protein
MAGTPVYALIASSLLKLLGSLRRVALRGISRLAELLRGSR